MRQFTTILLALALSLQTLAGLWVVLSFKVSQTFIAEELCEQKEVEDNCCQGSCYLKKQLSKAEADTQAPRTMKQSAELLLSSENRSFSISPILDRVLGTVGFSPRTIGCYLLPIFGIFHPPRA